MHRARVEFTLMTQMGEDELYQWGRELLEEAKQHILEGEKVALDHLEIEAEQPVK